MPFDPMSKFWPPFVRNDDGTVTTNLPTDVPGIHDLLLRFRQLVNDPTPACYPALYPSYSTDQFEAMMLAPDDDSPRREAILATVQTVVDSLGADVLDTEQFNAWLRLSGQMRRTFTLQARDGDTEAAAFARLSGALQATLTMALPAAGAERGHG